MFAPAVELMRCVATFGSTLPIRKNAIIPPSCERKAKEAITALGADFLTRL